MYRRRRVAKPTRPRRKVARRKALPGKRKDNTKVGEKVVYRVRQNNVQYGATTVTNYFYSAFSPYNSAYQNITACSEFTAQSQLWDEFCITSMKVTYRPLFTQALAGPANIQIGLACETTNYSAIDRDGKTPVSTSVDVPSKLLAYDSCKEHMYTRKWSRTMRCKQFWIDCAIPSHTPIGVSTQVLTNHGLMACLIHYGQNQNLANGVIGTYDISYSVQFRGKKPVAFTYDADSGSVIITPVENFGNPVPLGNPPTPLGVRDAYVSVEDGDIKIRAVLDDTEALRTNAPLQVPVTQNITRDGEVNGF